MAKSSNRIVIQCKAGYLHCFEPYSFTNNKELARFMVTAMVDKHDKKQIALIKSGIEAAIEEGKKTVWNGKIPANLYTPLQDGDMKEGKDASNFADMYYFVAKSKKAPEVVDQKLHPIYDKSAIYSGCIVNASFTFVPYKAGFNCGVTALLGNIQLVRAGKNLYGRTHAKDEFSVIEDDLEESDETEEDDMDADDLMDEVKQE